MGADSQAVRRRRRSLASSRSGKLAVVTQPLGQTRSRATTQRTKTTTVLFITHDKPGITPLTSPERPRCTQMDSKCSRRLLTGQVLQHSFSMSTLTPENRPPAWIGKRNQSLKMSEKTPRVHVKCSSNDFSRCFSGCFLSERGMETLSSQDGYERWC